MRWPALLLWLAGAPAAACPAGDFPPFYPDAALFDAALADTAPVAPSATPLSGIVVPHHLAAPHLVAGGLRLAAGRRPERIVLIHPDHFRGSATPFATTARGFRTVAGPVPGDPAGAAALRGAPGVSDSCLFQTEHGIRALLPFVARLFPDVPVLPLAVAIDSRPEDWAAMAETLAPLVGPGTLIVQSTDFSHYLPHHVARQRDQETLHVLAANDRAALERLTMPDHLDSPGAMWLHMALADRTGASPIVVASENNAQYTESFVAETTSYMVIAFARWPGGAVPLPFPGTTTRLFAGDVFVGRALGRILPDELAARRLTDTLRDLTSGLPVMANLEGVLLPDVPGTLPDMTLGMNGELFVEWARAAGIDAVSLANNHAGDLGPEGLALTRAALAEAGIAAAAQGEALQLGPLKVVALGDLGTNASQERGLIGADEMSALVEPDPGVPVVAFVHWGREWGTTPGARERALTREIAARGATAILGAHPHRASTGLAREAGGTAVIHSLGNFLFDQSGPRATGALAEVRILSQGTIFVRPVPIPNLFDVARGVQ